MQILLGPADANLSQEVMRLYVDLRRRAPADARTLWLVGDPAQASQATRMLAVQTGGMLAPGVKPLRQAADALLAADEKPLTPLTPVGRNRVLEEVLGRGAFSRRYQLLAEAGGSVGGLEYVAAAIREFTLANHTPEELKQTIGALRDPRATELVRVFHDYTEECQRWGLADRETRLLRACELLEHAEAPQYALVAATGIDLLTPLEWRFLRAVLGHSVEAVLAISVDSADSLDLAGQHGTPGPYEGPAELTRRLVQAWPQAELRWLKSSLPADDARCSAVAGLFRDPRELGQADTAEFANGPPVGLSLTAARGEQHEAQAAAALAKRLLRSGAPAERVVVACRQPHQWGPRLAEAFRQAGVPFVVEAATPLGDSAAARAVALVLRLATEDWPYEAVHAAVTSPRFTLFDAPLEGEELRLAKRLGFAGRRAAVEWVVNELLYPTGRRQLTQRVQWLAEQSALHAVPAEADADEAVDRRRTRLEIAAALAAPALATLSETCQQLTRAANPLAWHDRLAAALAELRYRSAPGDAPQDAAAVETLEDSFSAIARLADARGKQPPELELEEAARLVRGWLPRVTLGATGLSEGRVRLLSAEAAAACECDHLLLIGLDEQSFPRPDGAILPTGDDGQADRRLGAEMLLFCRLIAAPAVAAHLSYAALDDKAQPLNPSSFVAELERLFPLGWLRQAPPTDADQPLDARSARLRAVRGLMEGDAAGLKGLAAGPAQREAAESLAAGLLASHDRSHGDHFGEYEGVLAGDAARELLAAKFGPDHLWSASQLENYGECPFRFYLRHVLHADPVESLTLDVDYRRRGSLLHDAMVRFHQRVNELVEPGAAASTLDPEQFSAAFQQAVTDACEALAAAPHEQAVAEIEAMQAAGWGEDYHQQHEKYDNASQGFDEPLAPRHFEARFGPEVAAADAPRDPLSTSEPFAFQAEDLEILITGQVDRIDVGRVAGQLVFSIIDYKTARQLTIRQEDIESGRLLQLVLYAIAVSDHLLKDQDAAPWRAGYWAVQAGGFKTRGLPQPGELDAGRVAVADDWAQLVEAVRSRVRRIVADVREARFPVFNTDENCGGRCEFRTVCRVGQARSLGKTPGGEQT